MVHSCVVSFDGASVLDEWLGLAVVCAPADDERVRLLARHHVRCSLHAAVLNIVLRS